MSWKYYACFLVFLFCQTNFLMFLVTIQNWYAQNFTEMFNYSTIIHDKYQV